MGNACLLFEYGCVHLLEFLMRCRMKSFHHCFQVFSSVAIPLLLYDGRFFEVVDTGVWGTWLIWLAAVLTVWSMVYYLQRALPEIRARAR